MASSYWIKLYHEMLDDPKMGRLTDRQFRCAINLFLLAGDCELDGILPGLEDIDFRLRSPEGLEEDLKALTDCNILSVNGLGEYFITHWQDRQSAMTNKERQSRFRESKRKDIYYGNDNVTTRYIDIDKDKEVDEDRDEDVEGNNSADSLVKTFVEYTNLKAGPGSLMIADDLVGLGVKEEDIIKAVDFLNSNDNCKCTRFLSVKESSIIEMNKRKALEKIPDEEDYRKYLKGDLGHIGNR